MAKVPAGHPKEKAMFRISTAHMPCSQPDWGKLRVLEHEYGFIVYVNKFDEGDVPEWLMPLWKYARRRNVQLIDFDRDWDAWPAFQAWEW